MNVLTEYANEWKDCKRIASEWSGPQYRHRAEAVRQFMRGCGIDIEPTGDYTWQVVRFVKTFQLCIILDGIDINGRFDYWAEPLDSDGKAGTKTMLAMARSRDAGYKVWKHLQWAELAVKDPNGKRPTFSNPVIYSQREPVILFAMMRTHKGSAIRVASWFRSKKWHVIWSRSTKSQHLTGNGFDFDPHPSLTEAVIRSMIRKIKHANVGGVGVDTKNGRIIGPSHADCRDVWSRWTYKR